MTMTITVKDRFADQVIAFLNTLPKDAVAVESSRPWYSNTSRLRQIAQGARRPCRLPRQRKRSDTLEAASPAIARSLLQP